ncbi:MAG: glutamyl-tRNA (Gln) amidotransferase, subunit [Pseudomonadota bacterium]|jgi:aspartyl-tRNA(Asn)/glutamyl-tRNA(Gln) amidotransferase subunit A
MILTAQAGSDSDPLNPQIGIERLHARLRAGALDPVELAQACLGRVASMDPALHSFITISRERALEDAQASRARWRSGRPLGPCDGLPIALKDNIDVAGLPCTAGTEAFRHRVPTEDAVVAARLRRAGTVLLGKLNMHEAALGATTDNPVYGRCMNPLFEGHTPGGSSGGSGAAVAAGFVSMAVGTDTMGSVRIPAAYCGVFGFKPSGQDVLNSGIVPLHAGFDSPGPLARSASDLAVFARIMLDRPATAPLGKRSDQRTWAGLRIARINEAERCAVDPAILAGLEAVSEAWSRAGARISQLSWPDWQPSLARRAGLLLCEAEGLAWWRQAIGDPLPGLSAELSAMLRYPLSVPPARLERAASMVTELRRAVPALFSEIDVLLLPTSTRPSFPHGQSAPADQADLTALANFIGAPAWAIPFQSQGTVGSLQLIAAPGRDDLLLSLAGAIDQTEVR